jgi:hypothetical protein
MPLRKQKNFISRYELGVAINRIEIKIIRGRQCGNYMENHNYMHERLRINKSGEHLEIFDSGSFVFRLVSKQVRRHIRQKLFLLFNTSIKLYFS